MFLKVVIILEGEDVVIQRVVAVLPREVVVIRCVTIFSWVVELQEAIVLMCVIPFSCLVKLQEVVVLRCVIMFLWVVEI